MIKVVEDLQELDTDLYRAFFNNCDNATPFHSIEWLSIINEIRNDLKLKFLILKNNNDWVAVMPYFVKKYFPLAFVSMPYSGYGGFIYNKSNKLLIEKEIKNIRLNKKIGYINSFDDNIYSLTKYKKESTWIIECNKTYNDFILGINSKTRNQIRKSMKSGVEYKIVETEDEVDGCKLLYEKLVKKHNIKGRYDNCLFSQLRSNIGDTIDFWIAKYNGKVIAYAVFLNSKDTIFYWLSAFDIEYSKLNAPLGILDRVLEKAFIGENIKIFNLGAVPKDNLGLLHFKKNIGAIEKSYNVYCTRIYKLLK